MSIMKNFIVIIMALLVIGCESNEKEVEGLCYIDENTYEFKCDLQCDEIYCYGGVENQVGQCRKDGKSFYLHFDNNLCNPTTAMVEDFSEFCTEETWESHACEMIVIPIDEHVWNDSF